MSESGVAFRFLRRRLAGRANWALDFPARQSRKSLNVTRRLLPLSDCVLHTSLFTLSEIHTPLCPLHPACHPSPLCRDPHSTRTVIPFCTSLIPTLRITHTLSPGDSQTPLWIVSALLFFDSVSSLRAIIRMSLVGVVVLGPSGVCLWLMSVFLLFAHFRVLQDFEMVQSPSGNPGQHYCSSPSNQSTSSDPGPCGTWAQKAGYDG